MTKGTITRLTGIYELDYTNEKGGITTHWSYDLKKLQAICERENVEYEYISNEDLWKMFRGEK